MTTHPRAEPDEDFDFLEGTNPDDIDLGPDALPVQLGADVPPEPPGDTERPVAERSGPARLTVVLLALACTVLGYGLATVVSTISSRPNDVDVGFTRDMLTHHDQAMTMSLLLLDKPDIDHLVRDFAFEVLIIQRREVGIMDTYLAEWGKNRGDPDRMSMVWMNMATPIAQMPGMQSDEQMRQLRDATGPDAERLFLTMMREHHLGGVHMADYAAARGSDDALKALAARMSRNQKIEANEYTALLDKLGLE